MTRDMASERLLYTIAETAELMGMSRSHVYQAINRGEIPVIHVGRSARVPRAWLTAWVERETTKWEAASEGGKAREVAGK